MEEKPIQIKQLDNNDYQDWNDFVESRDDGTFFHLAEWKNILQEIYNIPAYFLYAVRDNHLCAVLPLAYVKSYLFGNVLASTPFCVYGGAIGQDEEALAALEEHAILLSEQLGADYLELRNINRHKDNWITKDHYFTFRKFISHKHDDNFNAIPRKQRAMVRKGTKLNLAFDNVTDIDKFYFIYSTSVRNLGTPVYPKTYFKALLDTFGNRCLIHLVKKDNVPISCVLSFIYKDQILPYYAGGLPDAYRYKAFDFMYWQLMSYACDQKIRYFDYGRSIKGTGAYSFKKNWGFEPQQLHYQCYLNKAKKLPDINPNNPKFKLMIKLWQHLPLLVANQIGPLFSRSLW